MDEFKRKEWIIWPYQAFPGDFNMASDHFLARGMNSVLHYPILRFFAWKPYCISLGYHQIADDINRDLCRDKSIDVVRRPTGGRAILHAQELTYSVIYPLHTLDVESIYKLVHIPFVEALTELGVPAEFQASRPDFRSIYRTDRAAACFATSARYEVEAEGKKLVGSAQRIYENAVLQHGSILFGNYHESLTDYLKLDEEKRQTLSQYIRDHTSHIWKFNPNVTPASLARKIREKYEDTFSIRFTELQEHSGLLETLQKNGTTADFSILRNQYSEKMVLS